MATRILALVACLVLSACGDSGSAPGKPHPPNVVLLVMDTVRADRCTVNGYGRPTTPALAALAAEGAKYLDAWTPAGWTGPSHASLFTGLEPRQHGFIRGVRMYLGEESETLAERLAAEGYRTGCFTNNDLVGPAFGLTQGFDTFVPFYEDPARPYPFAPATHRKALDWAFAAHDEGRPFFLFLNDMEAHFPYAPPEDVAARFLPPDASPEDVRWAREVTFGEMFAQNAGLRPLHPDRVALMSDLYDAEIACLDGEVGKLVEALRAKGILDETVFIVVSDHGENLGDHGLMDHMFSLHRTICHVPLVLRYPARVKAGTVVTDLVRLEDVYPTVLDLLGLPAESGLTGRTLSAALPGRWSRAVLGPASAFVDRMTKEYPEPFAAAPLLHGYDAFADGRFHYILRTDGAQELYDLSTDPEERRNLSTTRPKECDDFRERLKLP